jgi:hypothetical protein
MVLLDEPRLKGMVFPYFATQPVFPLPLSLT